MEFNESAWIKLVFLLADTQAWLDELSSGALHQPPLENKHKLHRKTYHLGIAAMAHILEWHYYKIPRHPGTGKFHIPVTHILDHIREAGNLSPARVPGCLNFQRVITTSEPVGFDRNGEPAYHVTVISGADGEIITAFPGTVSTNAALSTL